MPNFSPWIAQLKRERPELKLEKDEKTDIAIIGGGIAGVSTAYFILKNTDERVALVEAGKVAHGATGHNAGQLVAAFERPFTELVQEFGLDLAAKGLNAIISSWDLLEEIYRDARLTTPLHQFTGYGGWSTLDQVNRLLEDMYWEQQAGIHYERLYLKQGWKDIRRIDSKFHHLYSLLPHQEILDLLETRDTQYMALLAGRRGTMNSALFTEELTGFLLKKYADRFAVYEHSPVKEVELEQKTAILKTNGHRIHCGRVVLCTNGFENIHIHGHEVVNIEKKFHQMVTGFVGYMAGYYEEEQKKPGAFYYISSSYKDGKALGDAYFYLTRRPYEGDGRNPLNLVCIGGPEKELPETRAYSKQEVYPESAQREIDTFIHSHVLRDARKKMSYAFTWHGLMGYTPNGVRCVGEEPCNRTLLYNLGCNGIGILPSIYGGKRISDILAHKKMDLSIFDPRDLRCTLPSRTHLVHEASR
jgi:glycine/D-amino acid oxidase-like deaminating enzyme